jgi:hypothetical protein
MKKLALSVACSFVFSVTAADHLPPLADWQGASLNLIQPARHAWLTPAEASDLTQSPDYQSTMQYLERLAASTSLIKLEVIGKSPQGRAIYLVKAGTDPDMIGRDGKAVLLAQAGIHSGEIDGKDAGLMLLRDIVHGDKADLLKDVNLLFIPIFSVDGHERSGKYNRMNQRGPELQGWRATAQNLNLNRDYMKAEAPEMQALLKVLNNYQPDLYLDIHVTDGEDYQYDITYGFNEPFAAISPNAASWLASSFRSELDHALTAAGHIPGPLVFARDSMDFSQGLVGSTSTPRFSNGYGDLRHIPTVLVENHSLKPYKQRVLGTYVLLEHSLKLLQQQGSVLKLAKKADENARPQRQVLAWKASETPELIHFKGIEAVQKKDPVTGLNYQTWTGKAITYEQLPVYWEKEPAVEIDVPKAYWIPPEQQEVIAKLALHGVQFTTLKSPKTIQLQQLTATSHQFATRPFEGRFGVQAEFSRNWQKVRLAAGSVRVSTDQPLGALAVALLEPTAPDSLFSWGYMPGMFERVEYFEPYAIVPLIEAALKQDKKLKAEFDEALKQDKKLASDPKAKLQWFYQRLPYYDQQYLKYPILIE